MKLNGKTAVVTGASSGMGRAIATLFAEEGARVLAVARRIEKLEDLAAETLGAPGEVIPYAGDMMDLAQVEQMIDEAVSRFGRLDILVNNAGKMDNFSPVGQVDDAMWESVFRLNLEAPMAAMRRAVNQFLIQGGGTIVNISSLAGLYGTRAGATYTASKHALVGLTKNTAYMYAGKNIRCNAICPGGVETGIGEGEFMKKINAEGMERTMSGIAANPRTGKPAEIARIALFLASEDSSFINGQAIASDAGWSAY